MHELRINEGQTLPDLSSTKPAVLALLFTGIACLRLYYCGQLPVNTGDLPRHIFYGLYTAKMGLSAAGHSLLELNPSLPGVSWSSLPYNYPIVALLFFTLIVKISPTIFFAKLALTLIEAINSVIIFKYSNQRLLALLYWASPISIWWVSHEGQFEPLQNFFALSALWVFRERKCLAFVLLALAIQVKITAILFIPFFVLSMRQDAPKDLLIRFAAFAAGFAPTFIAMLYYPIIMQIFSTSQTLLYNPYYWNVLKHGMFGWNPGWLVSVNECATYGMLLLLVVLAVRRRRIGDYFAPICFIILCKIGHLCQFWYFVLYMSFLLPIQDKRERLLLFSLTPLLDISSLVQIISGPFGYTVGNYYKGVGAFMKHII